MANTINLFNFGLQRNLLNVWQLVVIPITSFGTLPTSVKGLKIIMAGGTVGQARQWDIDLISLTDNSVPSINEQVFNILKDGALVGQSSSLNFKGAPITVTNDPINKKIDVEVTGGGAILFPNGFEDVTESRDFLHSDVGKALRLVNDNVFLTMPEGQFWTEEEKGQVIVVIADATNVGFDKTFENTILMKGKDEDNNKVGEYCLLVTGETDGQSDVATISSAIIKDGDDWKTAIKYLYDKVGLVVNQEFSDAMTLLIVGAPINNPTGGVAVVWTNTAERPTVDIACYSNDFSNLTGLEVINFNTTNTQATQIGIFDQNSGLDDTKLIFVNDNGVKSTYLIGLPTNDSADEIVLRDSATNELFVTKVDDFIGYRGTATLSSGTVTVSTDKIKTGWKIFVSVNTPSGTQGFLSASTADIVDGTSFVINSTNAGDSSTVNWWIAP